MSTVEENFRGLIEQSGLVGGYKIMGIWNAEVVQSGQRALVIRNANGLKSDRFSRRQSLSVFGMSEVNDQSLSTLRTDMDSLVKYLLQNHQFGCIIGIEVVGDLAGLFQNGDGRYYYKFDVIATSVI